MDQEFERLVLSQSRGGLNSVQLEQVYRFYQLLLKENEVQNLTRLVSVQDFVEGHLMDVLELINSSLLNDAPTCIDLGSGGGVPGLLSAILDEKNWILVESEKKKAEFLAKTSEEMGLSAKVKVYPQRIEQFLAVQREAFPIVARAVGPVDRIYAWIRSCSTWNKLILLKGPGWDAEWERFQQSRYRKELSIEKIYSYSVGVAEKKERKIVQLKRVPRGTNKK